MRIHIAHRGADGDEYVHTFKDASFSTERNGFVSVTGVQVQGSQSNDVRTVHYPVGGVVRLTETER